MPAPIADPEQIARLDVRRRLRGGCGGGEGPGPGNRGGDAEGRRADPRHSGQRPFGLAGIHTTSDTTGQVEEVQSQITSILGDLAHLATLLNEG